MYEKYATCLAFICALAPALSVSANPGDAATDLREVFEQSPQACAARFPAAELAVPGLLHSLYEAADYRLLWQTPERRTALNEALEQLADDGLDPRHYQNPTGLSAPTDDGQGVACEDLRISREYLRALLHLSRGRVSQERLEPFWRSPDSLQVHPRADLLSLARLGLTDLPGAFAAARPALAQYRALRQLYAAQRLLPQGEWPQLPPGRLLKPGQADNRVPLLAERLALQGYLPARPASAESRYDDILVSAVQRFQEAHGLQADGLIGNDTLTALNTGPAARLDQLRVNLERWRWLAGDIEPETLLVDIAGGLLTYYRDGQPIWQTRTQVGRPSRQTPQLKSLVNRLTLNPTWSVPPTIYREDKLPAIQQDPGFLAQHQLRVLDPDGKPLDPTLIDWTQPGNIFLRQDAGPDNPLGQLAVRFANPFAVYLHDTPSQRLFEKSPRAFSSGCVRVEGILSLLDLLLPAEQLLEVRTRLASGRTRQVTIERRLPIVLAYWTAQVTGLQKPVLRNDIYGLDARLLAALNTPLD